MVKGQVFGVKANEKASVMLHFQGLAFTYESYYLYSDDLVTDLSPGSMTFSNVFSNMDLLALLHSRIIFTVIWILCSSDVGLF